MAEHNGEVVAGALATAMAFLGALGAAIKLWPKKPEHEPETGDFMAAVLQRVATLEERANEQDRREVERMQWRAEIFLRLLDLDKKTSSILAILDERRHER